MAAEGAELSWLTLGSSVLPGASGDRHGLSSSGEQVLVPNRAAAAGRIASRS